jgi:hypothetical protein
MYSSSYIAVASRMWLHFNHMLSASGTLITLIKRARFCQHEKKSKPRGLVLDQLTESLSN